MPGNFRPAGGVRERSRSSVEKAFAVKLAPLPFLLAALCCPSLARADLDTLPVVELTAFKDGHALVRREGAVPINGNVARIDGLPEPVFGTFWPYAVGEGVELKSATAGFQKVTQTRTPLSAEEILTAAAGTRIVVHESRGEVDVSYAATIVGRPTRTAEEQDRNDRDPASGGGQPTLPVRGPTILLKTDQGTRVVPIGSINEFTLLGPTPETIEEEVVKTGLKLRIDRKDAAADGKVTAGLSYVQKGFKWVPQYRITLGENGQAKVALQAALVNDLIDLEDATVRLVVGVPTFAFAGTTDPISLQVSYNQVMQADGRRKSIHANRDRFMLSNSIQSQVYSNREAQSSGEAAPEVAGGARTEDLYVYTLEHVTLAKGERMTIPVKEFDVPYEDRYEALLPLIPPRELLSNDDQRRMAGQLIEATDVSHSVVLTNNSDAPFTTAPALLYRDGQILAQSLMTYAAPGGNSEVHLGAAVEVRTKLEESIVGRKPEPNLRGMERFERILLKGEVKVTNRRPEATTLQLTKLVPGVVTAASPSSNDDAAERRELGPADMAGYPDAAVSLSRYGTPNWWASLNPTTEVKWEVTVPAGESVTVTYEWHYFWRW